MLWFIAILLLQLSHSNCSPVFVDSTTHETFGPLENSTFHNTSSRASFTAVFCPSESGMRGVDDILHACGMTILACVWISVHPNIPRNTKWATSVLQRVVLALYTIVLPDIVVFWSLKQWKVAGYYAEKYKEYNWTTTHGFFLVMGGFVISDEMAEQVGAYRTVSPDEFDDMVLREVIEFPLVTLGELEDKSKGDLLTKAVVVLQTLWFVIQCAGRIHQRLVVTELEIVTLGFAFTNGLIYYFWMSKPLGVKCPVVLRKRNDILSEARTTAIETDKMELDTAASNSTSMLSDLDTTRSISIALQHPISIILCILSIPSGIFVVIFILIIFEKGYIDPLVSMDPTMLISSRLRTPERTRLQNIEPAGFTQLTNTKLPMLYAPGESFIRKNTTSVICGFVGFVVGALHCIAWNAWFPSKVEQVAWRMSAAWLAGLPVIYAWIMIMLACPQLSEAVLRVQPRMRIVGRKIQVTWNGSVWMLVLCGVMIAWDYIANMLYALSRIYSFVGALAALREVENGARIVVAWTRYIPHFS